MEKTFSGLTSDVLRLLCLNSLGLTEFPETNLQLLHTVAIS